MMSLPLPLPCPPKTGARDRLDDSVDAFEKLSGSEVATRMDGSNPSETTEDAFETVGPSRRRRRPRRGEPSAYDFAKALATRRRSLTTEDWLQTTRQWLTKCLETAGKERVDRIVCLGLGSPAAGGSVEDTTPAGRRKSQLQMLLLTEAIVPELTVKRVSFYDPAFTADDHEYFISSGFESLEEEPDLRVDEPTLFYMPHAPRRLYEKVVAANLSTLSNVSILGNSFAHYRDDPNNDAREAVPTIWTLGARVREVALPVPAKVEEELGRDVFNETSFHWIPPLDDADDVARLEGLRVSDR